MNVTLRSRVVDAETGAVLIEQTLTTGDDLIAKSTAAAEQSSAHVLAGHATRLEIMDPDGDIFPAGEWIPVVGVTPT